MDRGLQYVNGQKDHDRICCRITLQVLWMWMKRCLYYLNGPKTPKHIRVILSSLTKVVQLMRNFWSKEMQVMCSGIFFLNARRRMSRKLEPSVTRPLRAAMEYETLSLVTSWRHTHTKSHAGLGLEFYDIAPVRVVHLVSGSFVGIYLT